MNAEKRFDRARDRLSAARQAHAEVVLELAEAIGELDAAAVALARDSRVAEQVERYQAMRRPA